MSPLVYREELDRELQSILRYWTEYTQDQANGGFVGRIDENEVPDLQAPKGLVLHSRILWAFSAASRKTAKWIYLRVAERAYEYLTEKFIDGDHGGAFWSLDARGRPLQKRKQVYGIAFAIYGLCEYAFAAGNTKALQHAINLYKVIQRHSADPINGGYIEAFGHDWQPLEDLRLSDKDLNAEKTTNTHLHILEAYTSLYRAWPDPVLALRIGDLLTLFEEKIIDPNNGHLRLFFDKGWNNISDLVSFGHDIEAAWLLYDAAVALHEEKWIDKTKNFCLRLAAAAATGLENDGGLFYEKEKGRLVKEKHWWPQAEAMVGFLYAWKFSSDESWWQRSIKTWEFVKRHIRDPAGREWIWGVDASHRPLPGQDKAGFWKCPYHNTRACLQIMDILT